MYIIILGLSQFTFSLDRKRFVKGKSKTQIAKILCVQRSTLRRFIERNNISY